MNLEPAISVLLDSYEEWIDSPDFAAIPRLNDFVFSYTERIYLKRYASLSYSFFKREELILRSLKDAANRKELVGNFYRRTEASFKIYKAPFEAIKALYLVKKLRLNNHVILFDWIMKLSESEVDAILIFKSVLLNPSQGKERIDEMKNDLVYKILEILTGNQNKEESIRKIVPESCVKKFLALDNFNLIYKVISDSLASLDDTQPLVGFEAELDNLARFITDFRGYLIDNLSRVDKFVIEKVYEIYKWTDILDDAIIEACIANDDIIEGSFEILQIAEIKRLTIGLRTLDKIILDEERIKRYLTPECAAELRESANLESSDVKRILRSHGLLKKLFI